MTLLARLVRTVFAWLIGSFATYVLASLLHTQLILHELGALGVALSIDERLSTTWGDFLGLRLYGVVVALSMAIGFIIVYLLSRPLTRRWHYALGGAIAIATALITMRLSFSITPIASAREPLGLAWHCLAGAFGGWIFAHL